MTAPALPAPLRAALDILCDDTSSLSPAVVRHHSLAIRAFIESLPIRASGGDGEPVAWGVFDKNDCLWRSFDTQRDAEREVGHLNHRDDTGHYRACGPYTVVPLYTRPAAPASVERRMAFLNVEAAVEAAVKAEREACAKAIYAVRVVHRAEVERAVAEERAACAQVLNQMGDDDMASDREIAKWERAIEAIRARGAKS